MGRKAAQPAAPVETAFDDTATAGNVVTLHQAVAGHQMQVASAIGGELEPYNSEAEISRVRGLMAAGAQVMLELGQALIRIRENEPDARFSEILQRLNLERNVAYRSMHAARKFMLSLPEGNREAFNAMSRGKLYELLVLDDDQAEELAKGGTVLGLTLDEIDTMSTSELRRTLREERAKAKADLDTKDRQIGAKNEQIDKLDEQLDRLQHGGKDVEARLAVEREQAAVKAFQDASLELLGAIQRFDLAVADCLTERTEARVTLAESTVSWLFQRISQLANERGMPVDFEAIVDPLRLDVTGA